MRTCKWCGKSGWFLSLSKDGFCQSCESTVKSNVIQATQILNQSLALMKRGKGLDFRLSKAALAIEKLRELLPFYNKKLLRLSPSPQEWVAHIHSEQRKMVVQHVSTLFNQAKKEALRTVDATQRTNAFESVLAALSKYEGHLGKANTQQWQSRVESELEHLTRDVENAEKKEKGRAMNQYLETLDILRSEYTGEREQALEIQRVEKLIRDLGGKVPENRHAKKKKKPSEANSSVTHSIIIPAKKSEA